MDPDKTTPEGGEDVKIPTREELLDTIDGKEPSLPQGSEPEPTELTPTEQTAYGQGWRPKEEFQGDPNEWRPAKEWLERGELISKIKRLSNDVNEMREGYNKLYQNHLEATKQAYARAVQDLKAQRRAALESDDFVTADQIEDQIELVKERGKQAVQVTQPTQENKSEVFEAWKTRNPWYQQDEKLTTYADAVTLRILRVQKNIDPEELGRLVETEVRETFPDKFRKAPGISAPPSPNVGGSHRGNTATKGGSKYSDIEKSLTQEERQIMDTMVNKMNLMSKEEYLADYASVRRA